MSSTCGMNASSRGGENGTGVWGGARRITGASSDSNPSSAITADTSAPTPRNRFDSYSTSARDVFATDSRMVSVSIG